MLSPCIVIKLSMSKLRNPTPQTSDRPHRMRVKPSTSLSQKVSPEAPQLPRLATSQILLDIHRIRI